MSIQLQFWFVACKRSKRIELQNRISEQIILLSEFIKKKLIDFFTYLTDPDLNVSVSMTRLQKFLSKQFTG